MVEASEDVFINQTINILLTFMEDNKHPQFMVAIRCMTYNHKPYILDALNGFVMQKTTFPFIIILVDDASTDGEPEVIQKFISEQFDISDRAIAFTREDEHAVYTYARHLSNKQCYIIYLQLKKNLYRQGDKKQKLYENWCSDAKYIAICEGDDFWIDENKLQKQVDFLDEHSDYSMCFHAAHISSEGVPRNMSGAKCEIIENREYFSNEMFSTWLVPTASILYNKELFNTFVLKNAEWLTRGDIAWVLICASVGKVRGMSNVMSVYRMQPNSVSHNSKYRDQEVFGLPRHFKCLYLNFKELDKDAITWNIAASYYARMKKQNNPFKMTMDFFYSIYWNPNIVSTKLLNLLRIK